MDYETKILNVGHDEVPEPDSRVFTSSREKRLWIATLIVVMTIYATLGLAGSLAGALGDQGLNAATFVLGGLLILGAIATQGVKRDVGPGEIFIWLGVVAIYVLVFTRLTSAVERSHLIEYSVVAILIYQALRERRNNGAQAPTPALTAVGATAVIGTLDELIQIPLPNRVFDPVDIAFNIGAAIMAVAVGVAIGWARKRRFPEEASD